MRRDAGVTAASVSRRLRDAGGVCWRPPPVVTPNPNAPSDRAPSGRPDRGGSRARAGADATAAPAPRSALALAALILALIPCCPPVGLIGAFLGIVALRRIRRSGNALRGERIALAAILIGCAGSILSSGLMHAFAQRQAELQAEEASRIIGGLLDPEAPLTAIRWTSGVAPHAGDIQAARRRVHERFGAFRRFRTVSSDATGSWLRPTLTIAGTLEFDRGSALAHAAFDITVTLPLMAPSLHLRLIEIGTGPAAEERIRLEVGGTALGPASEASAPDEADRTQPAGEVPAPGEPDGTMPP